MTLHKLPWILCTIFSLLYFTLFQMAAHKDDPNHNTRINQLLPNNDIITGGVENAGDGLMGGFCVWGEPKTPNNTDGCWEQPNNSHQYAFLIDSAMTIAVFVIYLMNRSKEQLKIYVSMAFIIFFHGFLHHWIYASLDCIIKANGANELLGYIFYALFSFALSAIIFSFGFGDVWARDKVLGLSALAAAIVVKISIGVGTDWILSSLFAVSHPLASITGLFTKNTKVFSNLLGWAFLMATLVGVVELTMCEVFFREIGGHYWYDVFLHVSVILSLPPFWSENKK